MLFRCDIHKNCNDRQAFVARAPKLLNIVRKLRTRGQLYPTGAYAVESVRTAQKKL